ncbi:MAG TPA: hypothetical protein VK939_01310 [Longimicrobiales bacterium]|nr:hypothetical protein [Longimicrobiales bacterium]
MIDRLPTGMFLCAALVLAACTPPRHVAMLPEPQRAFWNALEDLCGEAFAGTVREAPPGDTTFAAGLVMHVRECGVSEIRIPFHVGENRSRTWVLTRSAAGLRLKHDHRHEDGTEDEVTQYGGDTRGPGTATTQEFHADAHTAALIPAAATNVWTIEISPGVSFAYALRREGTDRRFRIEFDLTRPVAVPPAPWGHAAATAVPPTQAVPLIDGRVEEREWAGAAVTRLPDATEVLLLRDDEHVYVALRPPLPSLGSLCIQSGDEVRILHASMALGTAVYVREGPAWTLAQPFAYTMRESDDSDDTRRKRNAFLNEHGWVASTVPMASAGPALEYRIRRDLLDAERPSLGIVTLTMDGQPALARLPVALDDGCARLELVQGSAPEQARFDPAAWLQLVLGPHTI